MLNGCFMSHNRALEAAWRRQENGDAPIYSWPMNPDSICPILHSLLMGFGTFIKIPQDSLRCDLWVHHFLKFQIGLSWCGEGSIQCPCAKTRRRWKAITILYLCGVHKTQKDWKGLYCNICINTHHRFGAHLCKQHSPDHCMIRAL